MTLLHQTEILPLSRILVQAVVAFLLAMVVTPIYTHFAFKYQWWKQMRTDSITGEKAPIYAKLHAAKHKGNVPTMGGLMIIIPVALVTIFTNLSRSQTLLPVFVLLAAGTVGLFDDFLNIRSHGLGIAGMRGKIKFSLILGIAVLGALYFYYKLGYSSIHIPAVGDFGIGWLYIPLFITVVVSTANAVNITDGLDGLSGGLSAMAFSAYGIIAFFQGNYGIAGFCMAIVGAVLTYVWFNIHPARFFMGDSGSFALGTTLGVIAMLTNAVFVLPIIGAVFVVEAASSAIQIISKRYLHRKVFLSAPLHHHLEAIGWPETKVTMRLWVIGSVVAVAGLVLGLLGNHR